MNQSKIQNESAARSLALLFFCATAILLFAIHGNAQTTAFVQQAKLEATDGAVQDAHGFAVAISGDTAIVGAPRNGVVGFQTRGAAYIYVRTGATWTQQQKLIASDGMTTDQFGYSVAINGNTAAVGRFNTTTGQNRSDGKVYIFTRTGTTWTETQTLVSNDLAQGDVFGSRLVFENDTLVVSAYLKPNAGILFQGAVYVFTRPAGGGSFTQQAKLLASDGAQADYFGYSIALSGDTAVIGAAGQAGFPNSRGKAYVFVRNGSAWSQQQILQASDGVTGDSFGFSVGVEGDTAIIGATGDGTGSITAHGAAYLYVRNGGAWTEQQKITHNDIAINDGFGTSVAVKGNTAVIGATGYESLPSQTNHGAVFVFTRSGAAWTQTQTLIHSPVGPNSFGGSIVYDGSSILTGAFANSNDKGAAYVFKAIATNGQSKLIGEDVFSGVGSGSRTVAISDNTALMGNLNFGTYLYQRSGSNWQFVRKLTATVSGGDTAPFTNGGAAILGDVMVVGSPTARVNNVNGAGAVYVFNRVGGNWTDVQRLLPPDTATGRSFGTAIAMTANTIVIGDENKAENGNLNQGAVYVYVLSGGTWTFQQKLVASDGAAQDNFGQSAAISGDTVIVGSPNDDTGAVLNHGSAYVFTRAGLTWTQQPKFTSTDNADSDRFGRSVAIDEQTAVISAPGATIGGSSAGAVYTFNRTGSMFTQAQKLIAANGDNVFTFGDSIALSGNNLVVGSPNSDDLTQDLTNNGAVYVYQRSGATFNRRGRLLAYDRATADQLGISVGISGNYVIGGAPGTDFYGLASPGAGYVFDLNTVSFSSPTSDFDGDGKTDLSVFRPSNGTWYFSGSTSGFSGIAFGTASDKIVPADYDGDGKSDVAVYRAGIWYLQRSTAGFTGVAFGASDDIPVPADYDGDGKADIAVYRPSNGGWYRINSSNGQFSAVQFGAAEDKPTLGDFDGDGKADIAVYRPSNGTWYRINSSNNQVVSVNFGAAEDLVVPADYDGDGKTDVAVFRPSSGTWYLQRSQLGFTGVAFGQPGDKPVPADYDGDGKADVAIYRSGVWYLQRSQAGFLGASFGASDDLPTPNAFVR